MYTFVYVFSSRYYNMINPRISKNGVLPCRVEGTKSFTYRNFEHYYADVSESGYIRFGEHRPDSGVCAETISIYILGKESYIEKSIEFLEYMKEYDPRFHRVLNDFYNKKFKKDVVVMLHELRG